MRSICRFYYHLIVSDDTLKLKTMCVESGKCLDGSTCVVGGDPSSDSSSYTHRTVCDLLPAECSAIPGILLLPKVRRLCEGMKMTDCNTLSGATILDVCWGTQGADCETIQTVLLPGIERQARRDTVFRNIFYDDPILFCGRVDNPPYILIKDDVDACGNPVTKPNQVKTHLSLNDLLVGVVVDRYNTSHIVSSELNAMPGCLQDNTDT